MIYTAAAVVYLALCAAIGLWRRRRNSDAVLAALLASGMVGVQLLLLLTQ